MLTTDKDVPIDLKDTITTAAAQITNESLPPMNRAQRRAWNKKNKKKNKAAFNAITDTAKKLDYIDLIQRLRKLNERKNEENEATQDGNTSV